MARAAPNGDRGVICGEDVDTGDSSTALGGGGCDEERVRAATGVAPERENISDVRL